MPKKKPIELPPELDTEEFRTSWNDWVEHRKQMRKPMTEICMSRQLAKLQKWANEYGVGYAIASIEQSIERGGWQGLFDPIVYVEQLRSATRAMTTEQMNERGLLN